MNFGGWTNIAEYCDLDEISNFILDSKRISDGLFVPDHFIYNVVGYKRDVLNILDFGCGLGRNTFGMRKYSDNWSTVGYDSKQMISRINEYRETIDPQKQITNVTFISDWKTVSNIKFDVIYCGLVLQHISEQDLNLYLKDFKNMTKKLVVSGRRSNDDLNKDGSYKNTWKILENNGIYPPVVCLGTTEFNHHGNIEYLVDGRDCEHFTCVYMF